MVGISSYVKENRWRGAYVEDHEINVAIVVEVAERNTTTRLEPPVIQSCCGGNVFEGAVAPIVKKQDGFAVFYLGRHGIHFRIDVAVRHKKIGQSIVVKIDETGTPSHVREGWLADLRLPYNVGEAQRTLVPIQIFRLVSVVSNYDIEFSVAIEIAEIHAHRTELLAVRTCRDPGGQSDFLECPVVFVVVEIIEGRVVGDIQIGPTIVIIVPPNNTQA